MHSSSSPIKLFGQLVLASTLLLSVGCASTPEPLPSGPFIEATPAPAPEPVVQVVGVPYAQPVPGQAQAWPPAEPTAEEIEQAKQAALSPDQVMDQANEAARQAPTPEGFVNSTLIYDYMPGALYQVWGAPNHFTVLTFAQGEEIISFGAGDTIRWQVDKTWSGEGPNQRYHLIVQPVRKGLHTSMLVTTNFGTYTMELKSYQHSYLAGVTFRYPRQKLAYLQSQATQRNEQARQQAEAQEGELAVALDRIEDRYRFIVDDPDSPPRWMPRRVFHDGKRTFIDFGKEMGDEELPALFLYSKSKKPRVAQYTMKGRYMIVAGIVELAMLRLGEDEDETVGLELKKEARR